MFVYSKGQLAKSENIRIWYKGQFHDLGKNRFYPPLLVRKLIS